MIGAERHNKNKTIPTLRLVGCPACNKPRLHKQVNEDGSIDLVSQETVEVREQERYLEVCEFCIARYKAEDERFVKANLKKLAKAFGDQQLPDGETDHKDFSLN